MTDFIEDKTYKDAVPESLGKFIGGIFEGLLQSPMTRDEAMIVIVAYVQAFAQGNKKDDSNNKV
jgi:hypothetical protein